MSINDYPPWIQAAAKAIAKRQYDIESIDSRSAPREPEYDIISIAEIIARHYEVCPHFAPPRPEDTARVLAMKDEIEQLKKGVTRKTIRS